MKDLLKPHKVYVVGGNYAIERIFSEHGAVLVPSVEQATMCCFTGGADVSPELYREPKHPTTQSNPRRDKFEVAIYGKCVAEGRIPIGICRGGQLLNVLNGGSLWQDVSNHAIGGEHPLMYEHYIAPTTSMVRTVMVTSTHHQMMIPNTRPDAPNRGQVWAYAGMSTRKESGIKQGDGVYKIHPPPGHQSDCEIVYYPKTKSLCFQPHPEYNSKSTRDLFFTCIERVLAA